MRQRLTTHITIVTVAITLITGKSGNGYNHLAEKQSYYLGIFILLLRVNILHAKYSSFDKGMTLLLYQIGLRFIPNHRHF